MACDLGGDADNQHSFLDKIQTNVLRKQRTGCGRSDGTLFTWKHRIQNNHGKKTGYPCERITNRFPFEACVFEVDAGLIEIVVNLYTEKAVMPAGTIYVLSESSVNHGRLCWLSRMYRVTDDNGAEMEGKSEKRLPVTSF